jgi:hypothetical protein
MITLKKQNEFNTKFITYFKNLMSLHNVSVKKLIDNFKSFEQNNIVDVDEVAIIILKSMLDIPYYKDLKETNILLKFRSLQQALELIQSDLIDDTIISKLDELRNST